MDPADSASPESDLPRLIGAALAPVEPRRIQVAYSGGVDSTALLLAARAYAVAVGVPLVALHAHHGLSDHADTWQTHCEQRCRELDLPLVTARLDVGAGASLEARARSARYAFFAQQVAQGDALLLAHHREDQLETRLLRLFQGRGMTGMTVRAQRAHMTLVRPFLECEKESLVAFVRESGFDWIEDDSNADLSHDRNYLRREIVPRIRERWPQLGKSVRRVGGLLDVIARQDSGDALFGAELHFPRARLEDPEEGRLRLRWLLERSGVHGVTDRALNEFLTQCARGDRARLEIDAGRSLVLKDGVVRIRSDARNSL